MRAGITGARSLFDDNLGGGAGDVPSNPVYRWLLAAGLILILFAHDLSGAQTVTIDGSQTFQTLDGLGANIHYFAWTNDDLKPVIDALVDQAGMRVFRVVFDNADWEATNLYVATNVINWGVLNPLYGTDRFQHLWGLIGYLNQKGISNGVMVNFQGVGPLWMGQPLTPGLENPWAQMIASLLVYARNTQHLKFNLVGPDNEMNLWPNYQGVATSGPAQYVTMLRDLANQLDYNGLGDFRIVGPDLANTSTNWMPDMIADSTVMAKVAHFGVHSYLGAGDDSYGVTNYLAGTAYANRGFWMTEYNVWCPTCENGQGNSNDWTYSRGTALYLLAHLANGASSALVWEGYDSIEATKGPGWSYWGLFGVDDINAIPKTYTARKDFYTVAQISKYLQPGAQQIGVNGSLGQLVLEAYYNPRSAQLSLVGVNTNSTTASLSCTLASLPQFTNLNLSYTTSTTNLAAGASVPVVNGNFSVTIPADCVFAINGQQVPPPAPALNFAYTTNCLTLMWPGSATNFSLATTTNPGCASWCAVTNLPQLSNGQYQVSILPAANAQYFRLNWP